MNARIEKDFYFQTALHFAGEFWINSYEMTLSIIVETDSELEQNVAIDRVSYYIKEILQNCILVDADDCDSITKYRNAGLRVCELPAEPYDHLFATVLLLKLNAIMEGKLRITDMVLGSTMSEGVRYNIVSEVAESSYPKSTWWNKADTSINNLALDSSNVVKLFDDNEWISLDLGWK